MTRREPGMLATPRHVPYPGSSGRRSTGLRRPPRDRGECVVPYRVGLAEPVDRIPLWGGFTPELARAAGRRGPMSEDAKGSGADVLRGEASGRVMPS